MYNLFFIITIFRILDIFRRFPFSNRGYIVRWSFFISYLNLNVLLSMCVSVCVCECWPSQATVEQMRASCLHWQLQGLAEDAKFWRLTCSKLRPVYITEALRCPGEPAVKSLCVWVCVKVCLIKPRFHRRNFPQGRGTFRISSLGSSIFQKYRTLGVGLIAAKHLRLVEYKQHFISGTIFNNHQATSSVVLCSLSCITPPQRFRRRLSTGRQMMLYLTFKKKKKRKKERKSFGAIHWRDI